MTKTKIMAWREKEREGRGDRREQKTEGEREWARSKYTEGGERGGN